ncbi:hypothetical protein VM1G_11509 [Cytospora mali]|uniref:Uncharacterized protein n=1 Tax=Cytospora mali TaxID=578113 RepID=A0A194VW27_CYTMA|nr:hypothetical protein VM1G_11509 [Valsa mali]
MNPVDKQGKVWKINLDNLDNQDRGTTVIEKASIAGDEQKQKQKRKRKRKQKQEANANAKAEG